MNDISDNCWLRFDDSIVTKYDINKLKEDTFGGDFSEKNEWFPQRNNMYEENSRSAYILVYERNFKSPIMELVDYNLDINIEADGGINDETSKQLIEADCDILVSGSYIVSSENFAEAVKKLKEV